MKSSLLRCLVSLLPLTAIATTTISSCAQASRPGNSPIEVSQTSESTWRRMNPDEEAETWDYILNSPLAIAALNQLIISNY